MYTTSRPSWTIADASRLLRVSTDALYDACASGQMPSYRIGNTIRIPSAALRMKYVPEPVQNWGGSEDLEQLELPLDPSCLIPVRRFRNTRELIGPWEYERKKYGY